MTLEEFETAIQNGPGQVAENAALKPPGMIRTRGDQRRLRALVAGAVGLAVVLAAGGASAAALAGRHAPGGSAASAASPSGSVTASSPATPSSSPTATGSERLGLAVTVPSSYEFGRPSLVTFHVTNSGASRIVTVTLGLGHQHVDPSQGAPPFVARAGHGGGWVQVPVQHGPQGWTSSYSLQVSSGHSTEKLLVVPAAPVILGAMLPTGPTSPPPVIRQPLSVTLAAGHLILADQSAPAEQVLHFIPALQQVSASGGTREFRLTVRNPSANRFPVLFYVSGGACASGAKVCTAAMPAKAQVQWLDGSAWRDVSSRKGPDLATLTTSKVVEPHSSITLELRYIGESGSSGTAQLGIQAMTSDRTGIPGNNPDFGPITSVFLMSAPFPAS